MSDLKDKLIKVTDVIEKWSNSEYSEDMTCAYDWRSRVLQKLKEGDVEGMKAAAVPSVQYKVIELAHEAAADQTKLQAATFLLGQAGHGPIQRIQHDIHFEKMPSEQLMAVLRSKLENLQRLNPDFDLERLLTPPEAIDAEVVEVEPKKDLKPKEKSDEV